MEGFSPMQTSDQITKTAVVTHRITILLLLGQISNKFSLHNILGCESAKEKNRNSPAKSKGGLDCNRTDPACFLSLDNDACEERETLPHEPRF